jgi:hypothetical protein
MITINLDNGAGSVCSSLDGISEVSICRIVARIEVGQTVQASVISLSCFSASAIRHDQWSLSGALAVRYFNFDRGGCFFLRSLIGEKSVTDDLDRSVSFRAFQRWSVHLAPISA